MPRFPAKEDKIVDLAQQMYIGLRDNHMIWPAPPVSTGLINVRRLIYQSRLRHSIAGRANVAAAYTVQQNAMDDLITAMKQNLRYAENTVDYDDEKLKLLGWAGRKEPTPLAAPGQTLLLNVIKQGEGWIDLDWKAPADGGKPSAYKVTRRERPAGAWQEVHAAVTTEATIAEQPRGKELEYRIIAVNKAGEGEPSNTEMVVL